jgi:hypothetical protein
VLATGAALRRDWTGVRLHARRAARHGGDENLIVALQALGAAGQGDGLEARAHLARIRAREDPRTAGAMLRHVITGATLLLLGEQATPLVLTPVAEVDAGPRRENRLIEAYQAFALLLRAQWHANAGRATEAHADRERALSHFTEQESRFRHLARVLGRPRQLTE